MLIAGAEERFFLRVARVNKKNEILTNFQKLNKSQILGEPHSAKSSAGRAAVVPQ